MFVRSAIETDVGDGAAFRRVQRSLARIDGLLVALALLYVVVMPQAVSHRGPYLAAIAVFAVVSGALRFAAVGAASPRRARFAGACVMVLVITVILASAEGARGSIAGFYVLPVITVALTMGGTASALVLAVVVACRLALDYFGGAQAALTPAYGLALFVELLPLMLVAFLAATLVEHADEIQEQLRSMAERDDLTGVLNLEAFTKLVEEELRSADQRGTALALLLVDVEGLKSANERYGHEAGNRALKALAQALQRSCRSVDLVARYGGDEFVMYLSGAGAAVARVVANRVRHNVATTTLEFGGKLHRLTVGVGVAVFPADGRQLRDLLNKAAATLESDKNSRRPLPPVASRAGG
ncbi:MAG: hypothetical protein AMXMBFR8_09600 [Nevskiales bacterium]